MNKLWKIPIPNRSVLNFNCLSLILLLLLLLLCLFFLTSYLAHVKSVYGDGHVWVWIEIPSFNSINHLACDIFMYCIQMGHFGNGFDCAFFWEVLFWFWFWCRPIWPEDTANVFSFLGFSFATFYRILHFYGKIYDRL